MRRDRNILRRFVVILIIEYFLSHVNEKVDFFRKQSILYVKRTEKGSEYLIYDNIKKICKEKGISVGSVEKQAGLGNGAISKWNTSSPTIENLQAVAGVLKVSVNKLIG